jgi:hypothetical protein
MDFKKAKIEDIIEWCIANKQTEWLKATAAKQVEYKVYPRMKVPKIDEATNEQARDEEGKLLWTTAADKSKEPKIEMRPISFVQIKTAWMNDFGLGEPKKPKKKSMYELIAEL